MAKDVIINGNKFIVGKVGEMLYYVLDGKQVYRSLPQRSKRSYHRPGNVREHKMMRLIQCHIKHHAATILGSISPLPPDPQRRKNAAGPRDHYFKLNSAALRSALMPLVDREIDENRKATVNEVEQAVRDYAAANPTAIVIGHKKGFRDVYLTGEWPKSITLVRTNNRSAETIFCQEMMTAEEVKVSISGKK